MMHLKAGSFVFAAYEVTFFYKKELLRVLPLSYT